MIGIYKIQNLINNKVYIGQSKNINSRWRQHRYLANIDDGHLYRAMRKYGIDNFSFSVIEECSISSLNDREEFWIKSYDSTNPEKGYNIQASSENCPPANRKLTDQDVNEICNLLINSFLSQEEIAARFQIDQSVVSRINNGKAYVLENISYPLRKNEKRSYNCINCGAIISKKSTYCVKCAMTMRQKVIRPSREELKLLIRTLSFLEIGRRFNVSDNAIRKWCISEKLPSKKKEIEKYSDEEWRNI